jgi:hypothetical protein
MPRKRRPTLRQRRLAVKLARQYRDQFDGDEQKVEAALRSDENLVGIDPAMIVLIIELVLAAIKFFRNRKAEDEQSDDEVLAAIGAS